MLSARIHVQLGEQDRRRAQSRAHTDYPHRRNWEWPKATFGREKDGYRIDDIDQGRYSSQCTYRHWTYEIWVTSYAWLSQTHGREIGYHCWTTVTHLRAPRGYRWDRDVNGLKLISLADPRNDYHPSSDDLRLGAAHCREMLRQNATKRREAARITRSEAAKTRKQQADDRAAMHRAEHEGAAICMADSIRAGNCKAGTESFAARHGLDPRLHYRPTMLLKIANGQSHRVRLAVAIGLRRHRQEMSLGFCNLADHQA